MVNITNSDHVYFFSLKFPYAQCAALYDGTVPNVILMSENGVKVQVPANRVRKFVGAHGLHGRFRLVIDQSNKIKSFEQIC